MGKYDVQAIRDQVKKRLRKERDPSEFRPPKMEDGKVAKFRFFILAPFQEGDQIAGGVADRSMELFFIENGAHFMENKRYGCPRVIEEKDCPICQYAFDCIRDIKNSNLDEDTIKKQVEKIRSNLLPASYRMVNVYFPGGKIGSCNPPELQDKVMWFNAPTTVFNIWWDTLDRTDDGGDETDLKPYGVFYDEEASYLFQLEIYKKGKGNSYEKSKFLVTQDFRTFPIVRTDTGAPDKAAISKIFSQRHNLFDKLPDINMKEINRLAHGLMTGDSSSDNGGFDDQEKKPSSNTQNRTKTESKSTVDEMPVDDDVPTTKPTTKPKQESKPKEPDFDDDVPTTKPITKAKQESKPVQKQKQESDDDPDSEIDNLLSQMTDNE